MRLPTVIVAIGLFCSPAFGQGSSLSNLPSGGPISATDLFYDVQTPGVGGVKVTAGQLKSFIGGVSSISAGCGTTTFGAPIVSIGTIAALEAVNPQTLTSYTVNNADCGTLTTLTNGSAIAVTLPQAGQSNAFIAGWFADYCDRGVGTATITPTVSTINGSSSLALATGQCARIVSDGVNYQVITYAGTGGGAVSSVSNSDGTLTISPITGAVVASLALGHANTWTAAQTFNNGDFKLAGATSGTTILAAAATASGTISFPAVTDTVAVLGTADQTVAGGANVTSQSLSTGNVTIDCGSRPLQFITNGAAFTITAPANDGSCMLLVTNNASAGAITFSGFSVGTNTGDALTTTNTNKFTISIWRINGTSGYRIAAHQ